jgi:beta-N-acetylhexosaminidase
VVDEVDTLVSEMTLEGKVGQLFVVEVFGTSANDEDSRNRDAYGVDTPAEIVQDLGVGGVLYLAENVRNPLQVATLSNDLQTAAAAGSGIGLLIAADQEGGRVARIGEPATVFPPALTFGEVGTTDLTRRAAQATATELRAMGINQVYAPVADVVAEPESQIIGDRSFGSDPGRVAEHTAAATQGFEAGSVAATAKHWPGHGNTTTDSHVELAVIDIDRETWESVDRRPFEAAITAGIPAVMVGHIEITDVGGPGPATLSQTMIEAELRDVLGFDGLVVTDALRMDGVRNSASDADIAVRAIQAGADMLLLPFNFHVAREAVIEAVEAGTISEARLDESVTRILNLKQTLAALSPPIVDLDAVGNVVGHPAHTEINEAVRRQAP